MSSDIKYGIETYLNNYDSYVLKYSVIDNIKKDLCSFKNKMNKIETKDFLKEGYFNRTGISNISDLIVFGTSIHNPMLNIPFLEASMLIKYHESSIYQHTGISYETYKNYSKEEQILLLDTMNNILINKTQTTSDVMDEIERAGEE